MLVRQVIVANAVRFLDEQLLWSSGLCWHRFESSFLGYDIIVEPILTVDKFKGLFQLMYPSVVPLVKVGLKQSDGIKYFVNN